ncbi:hypothetical protein Bca52824_002989 [Brassica carinata]|uniref:Uncharacterized protein n=1 Tax=Brassica carinata TaxID=52824 RepID=A0A8X8BB22_BRACI|nr:hypothetical protein Bca52824_002989 [Brassica carinata]
MQINRLFNQQPPKPYLGRRATSSNNGVPGPAPPVVPPAPPAPPVRRPQRRYPDVSIAELMASPSRFRCLSFIQRKKTMASASARGGKMPPFMSSEHWNILQTYWETDKARKRDGTFADGRSKKIVEEVESAATERLMTDSVKESTATTPSVQQLNKLFIEDVFMGLDLLIATMVIQLHPHPLLSHVPCIWRQE